MKIGVVFDLDGTLIDTMGFHIQTFKKAATELGIKDIEEMTKKFSSEIGKPLDEIIENLLPHAPKRLKEQLMKKKWEYTLSQIEKIRPIKKSINVVKTLKHSGYNLAVFSSSIRIFVEKSLEKVGIKKYFDFIVTAEDVESKPSPKGLFKACKSMNCDSCIYVGDRKVDEITAKNAGYEFVYVQEPQLLKSIGTSILVSKIKLLKNSKIKKLIDKRIKEFEKLGTKNENELFKELAFCLLTANYSAEKGIKIQRSIGDGFLTLNRKMLEKSLRKLGYRYPKKRSEYIVDARKILGNLKNILKMDGKKAREELVKKIKGLGYKEASHFLRNCGKDDVAIIDFHIIDLLSEHWIIKKPKTLTRKKYLEIEKELEKISKKVGLKLSELDLYLWYLKTGKVLK